MLKLVAAILPKLAVFVVATAIGGIVAYLGVNLLKDREPETTAGRAPDYLLAGAPDTPSGDPVPAAFDLVESGSPEELAPLPDADLALAAEALLGAEPVAIFNPSGFPRITPITQFDGGPFQGANCTLASGAMLARLAYGIVTSGSILRTLQDDQDGGTGLDDLNVALWRGYGVTMDSGLIRPAALKDLLAAGYGAVVQGDYGKIPKQLRLQPSYEGGHAVYIDGYYPGGNGTPEAYYIIDPIGRPNAGYEGEWWPASVVDDFLTSFGGGRVAAMWAFPPGGVPPEIVGPDVLPLPSGGGGSGGEPGASPSPGASESPAVEPPGEPGSIVVGDPPVLEPVEPGVVVGGLDLIPILEICLVDPKPVFCPGGIEAVFEIPRPPIQVPLGPQVSVKWVDSDRPNVVLVGFTVAPSAVSQVKFWEADGTPATIFTATSMTSLVLPSGPVIVARLDTLAATTYHYQVAAGSGIFAGTSPVGTFTTGGGVASFDVSLSAVSSPAIKLGTGSSPYVHLATDAFAKPLLPVAEVAGCGSRARFGNLVLCLDVARIPEPTTCTRAQVSYELAGIEAESVLVRAFPTEEGVTADGGMTLAGVLEAEGPAPSGSLSVGCLSPGLTYHIVIDAVGDDRGVLAAKDVTVP